MKRYKRKFKLCEGFFKKSGKQKSIKDLQKSVRKLEGYYENENGFTLHISKDRIDMFNPITDDRMGFILK